MNISVPLSGDNDPELARIPSFWAAHLCFINKNIFSHFQANDEKIKPSHIAQHIWNAIGRNEGELIGVIKEKANIDKNMNFRNTYNIIKVIVMYEFWAKKDERIRQLEREIENERNIRKKYVEMGNKYEEIRQIEEEITQIEEEMRKKEEEMRKKYEEITQIEEEIKRLKQRLNS